MHVQFLAHSGFYIELEHICMIFDWWKGALPKLPHKPLLVFVSHHHPDHFNPEIFQLDSCSREVRFILGKDIRFAPSNCRRWGIREETKAKCIHTGGFQAFEPLPGIRVETLPSTDTGVAFVVEAEEASLFHAGDLNWWHWDGEHDAQNQKMEVDFKQYMEPLRNRSLDLAMMPLDPRQAQGAFLGLEYLFQLTTPKHVIPMHQWNDYSPTEQFLKAHPKLRSCVLSVSAEGQCFDL